MVAAQHAVDEQPGLAPEREPQVLVETGEEPRVGLLRVHVAQEEPLLGEVVDEGGRPRVGEHAAHLAVEHVGLAQLAADGGVEQLVVGDAAPQEERQARRELEVADRVRLAVGDVPGGALDADRNSGLTSNRSTARWMPLALASPAIGGDRLLIQHPEGVMPWAAAARCAGGCSG